MSIGKRIEWLDAVKAFGILLVFVGHCDIPGLNPYIYLFHMPLFFIVSGFCWNIEKNREYCFPDFLKKKLKLYVIPYFKICLICLVLLGIPEGIMKYGIGTELFALVKKYLVGIFVLSRGNTEWLPHCTPVWFLTCLFCAEVFMYFIMKSNYKAMFILLAGIAGYILSLVGKMPWNIDSALTAIPLLYFGIVIRKHWGVFSNPRFLLVLIPTTLAIFTFSVVNVDFDGNSFENILLMYIESSIIVLTIFIAFSWIAQVLTTTRSQENNKTAPTIMGGGNFSYWPRDLIANGV